MGYNKTRAFEQIRVPMRVKVQSEDGTSIEEVEVAHVFRVPPAEIREAYHRKLLVIKGRKIRQGSRSEASWQLWNSCIISVEGYDDLPKIDPQGEWKRYFNDLVGHIHIDNAVDMLMEAISVEEVETEKKSEPSSEPSS